jgi:hypothetical protein
LGNTFIHTRLQPVSKHFRNYLTEDITYGDRSQNFHRCGIITFRNETNIRFIKARREIPSIQLGRCCNKNIIPTMCPEPLVEWEMLEHFPPHYVHATFLNIYHISIFKTIK